MGKRSGSDCSWLLWRGDVNIWEMRWWWHSLGNILKSIELYTLKVKIFSMWILFQCKKSVWVHRKQTYQLSTNIKNIAKPDIIDLRIFFIFLPAVLLIWYHLLAQIFEAEGKKHPHISEAALFKQRMSREFACPELRIHEKWIIQTSIIRF